MFDKNSQMTDMIKLQNQQFINNTLQKQLFADVLRNYWCFH